MDRGKNYPYRQFQYLIMLEIKFFLTHGKGFQKIEDEFISGKPRMGFKIKNFSLNSNIGITRHKGICQNTIGYFDLNENGKLDVPFILVGAHLDHIGRGKNSSRAKNRCW